MASIRVIFKDVPHIEREGKLYYRIIHKRKVRHIHTGHAITRDEWDPKSRQVVVAGTEARCEYLNRVSNKLKENLARLERIATSLEQSGKEYSAADIVERYSSSDTVVGFISFARKIIAENRQMGKLSMSEHYSTTLNSLIRFHGEAELSFEEFDYRLVQRYEQYLKNAGLCPNSTSYYMRKLRAIYNQAVDRDLTEQRHPFKHVYTGVAKTGKRALPLNVIRSLKEMDLSTKPQLELSRDMFLFSFYTRGMSMIDMSYLKKSDLQNGILSYRRRKTGQHLTIRWEEPMQEIVRRYEISESKFLLPLIKSADKDNRQQYLNAAHMINKRLKELGRELGLVKPLTMYCARHAWASIAHENNVPISIISRGMGHDSEKTTRIYLASLDNTAVDKANNDIISLLDN